MLSTEITDYLRALRDFAGQVSIPGLGVMSKPLSLPNIFIEPQLRAYSPTASSSHIDSASDWEGSESAAEVLSREQAVVVLGGPGQGKTTLLHQYAWWLAQNCQHGRLPLLVELNRKYEEIEDPGEDLKWLHDRMPEATRQALGKDGWMQLCAALRSGDLAVLLDAFDELSPGARRQVSDRVGWLRAKGNQLVLSSRPHVYWEGPLSGFVEYEVGDLTEEQILRFADSACKLLAAQFRCPDYSSALQRVLGAARSQAAGMTRNPLLLSFMCLTATKRHAEGAIIQFPVRRAPLIGECVGALVAWHANYKLPSIWPKEVKTATVERILAPLALGTFRNRKAAIDGAAIEMLSVPDKQSLEHLVSAGFVEARDGNYVFPLETFREYFAAKAIGASADPYSVIRPHLLNADWQGVIAYTCGSLERIYASRIDLAMPSVTWAFVKGIGTLAKTIPHLIGLWLGPANKAAKKILTDTFEGIGPTLEGPLGRWLARSRQSTEFLITAVWRHRRQTRKRRWREARDSKDDLCLALRCAGEAVDCPRKLAVQLVNSVSLKKLSEEPTSSVIREPSDYDEADLSAALKNSLREGAACPQVRQVLIGLCGDADAGVRAIVAAVLGGVAWESSVRDQLLLLSHDVDDSVRWDAISSLGQAVWEPQVQERLLELSRDDDAEVRHAVVFFGLEKAVSEPRVRERLLEMICDTSAQVRLDVVTTLGKGVSDVRVRARLLEMTHEIHGSDEIEALAGALVRSVSDSRVQMRLIEMSRDESSATRWRLAKAMSRAVSEPCIKERLLEMTRDTDDLVRHFAALGLAGAVRQPQVQPRLLELSGDTDAHVREGVAVALAGAVLEPRVQECLLKLSQDKHPWSDTQGVRMHAVRSLAPAISRPRVQQRIVEMGCDRSSHVRGAVAKALAGAVLEPRVQERLLMMSRDEDFSVRQDVVKALAASLASPLVHKRIEELAQDSYYPVRLSARRALDDWGKQH